VAQNWAQFYVSEKSEEANLLKRSGEPGRTRTYNPLLKRHQILLLQLRSLFWFPLFSTIWGICFSLKPNLNVLKMTYSRTVRAQQYLGLTKNNQSVLGPSWKLHLMFASSPDIYPDVVSIDQHIVKPWIDGKLDLAPPVEDLANDGFALVGGRLHVVGSRIVAALVYARRKHFVNDFRPGPPAIPMKHPAPARSRDIAGSPGRKTAWPFGWYPTQPLPIAMACSTCSPANLRLGS
jgi:hypothetical protein